MALLVFTMGLSVKGQADFIAGSLLFSLDGLHQGLLIAIKANAIVLFLTAAIATIELTELGHALHHLRVPDKLVHMFLFTIRYFGVLHQEYERLIQAMKVRGFIARLNMHTVKSLANLVGMLLVKGFDRSERIIAAMKCRGFKGRFFILKHFVFHRQDIYAGMIMTLLALVLIVAEIL